MTSESCLQSSYTLNMHAHRSLVVDVTSSCISKASLAFSALAVRVRGKDVRLVTGNLPGSGGFTGDMRQDIGLIGRESREYLPLLRSNPGVNAFLPPGPPLPPIPDVNFSCKRYVMD